MKTHILFQIIALLASFSVMGVVQATCQADDPEIGDIGPNSNRVCETLHRDFPNATINVVDRKIQTSTDVIVMARIDGKPLSIEYWLVNADWINNPGPCLSGS